METQTKPMGIKQTLIGLIPQSSIQFPRPRYTSIRCTLSIMKVEYPDREFQYAVVDNGIEVTRVK